jgi:hypothetical protein
MIATRTSSRALGYAVAAASAVWVLGAAPTARADCAAPPPLEEAIASARVAFVGTVTGLGNDARTATFRVAEVWKGSVGETVVVRGGPPGNPTSVDRFFEPGIEYLVVPYGASGDVLEDNSCSSTLPYTSELDRFRPAAASTPIGGPKPAAGAELPDVSNSGWSWFTILLAAAALAAGGGAAWFVAKLRHTTGAP